MKVYEFPEQRLMQAVVLRAIEEAERGNQEAREWLDDEENEIYLQFANLNTQAVRCLLIRKEIAPMIRRWEQCLRAIHTLS